MPGAKESQDGQVRRNAAARGCDSHQHPHGRVPVNGPAGGGDPIRAAYQRRNRDLDPSLSGAARTSRTSRTWW